MATGGRSFRGFWTNFGVGEFARLPGLLPALAEGGSRSAEVGRSAAPPPRADVGREGGGVGFTKSSPPPGVCVAVCEVCEGWECEVCARTAASVCVCSSVSALRSLSALSSPSTRRCPSSCCSPSCSSPASAAPPPPPPAFAPASSSTSTSAPPSLPLSLSRSVQSTWKCYREKKSQRSSCYSGTRARKLRERLVFCISYTGYTTLIT